MKKLLFALLFLSGISVFAQFRQPGRGVRQAPPSQNQQVFDFNPEKAIGLITYNVEKTAKKVGVKKNKDSYNKFVNALSKFNKEVTDLKRINSFTFNQEKENVESSHKLTMESRDFSVLQKAYQRASETFKPIVKELEIKEKALDSVMVGLLSKKQLKKFKKYTETLKRKRS